MDKWDKRFLEMAELVASWSSCYQENRQVGAVIVKDKRIMTTGYNGAPSGIESCKTRGTCLRRELNIPSGTKLELCYAVHAEQNGTLYCTHQPCVICCKMIINAGIKRVVYKYGYPDEFSIRLFKEADIEVVQMNDEGVNTL